MFDKAEVRRINVQYRESLLYSGIDLFLVDKPEKKYIYSFLAVRDEVVLLCQYSKLSLYRTFIHRTSALSNTL